MKFTDGYWQLRPGVDVLHPVEVDDVRVDDAAGTMTVWATTKRVRGRGDTLNAPLVTLTYSSPAPGIVKVRVEHWAGTRPRHPEFAVRGTETHVTTHVDDESAVLTSGDLSVRVRRTGPWRVDFESRGRVLTSSLPKGAGIVSSPEGPFVHEQLALGVGEKVYGMGERFGPFVKNGQTVDIWNADGGTSSEQAYKNVPFYMTSGGYGVFVAHPELVSFEVASEMVERTQFSVAGQQLEYYVIDGPTPKDVLERYTALTGRPPALPAWSYGLWLTTSFTTSYDEQTVTQFIDGMAEREIPLSVFHFDCFWMREYQWCDFEWDPRTFPEPEAMLARYKDKGLRICVWINSYIGQRSALFAEAAEKGYLLRTTDGEVWQWDLWQAGMGLVDFTNPAAAEWYASKLDALLDMGVDCFKTDFGERIPTEGVAWFDGSDPQRMRNYYTHLYNRTVFELLERRRGRGQAALFARSATAGGQQYPVHWGGDNDSSFVSMAETLRGGLSLAMSGFGYWSHDIGGFEGEPDPAVFKRWLAFGLLSSHSRLHGSGSVRVPWAFDDEAVDVTRRFTRLKLSLLPYLGAAAREVVERGTPMMRPMVLELPEDRGGWDVDTQYLLGSSLLVAPVFSADGEVHVYVPEGTWTDLLSGETLTGPRWVEQRHGFDSLPVLVRPGTVLPVGASDDAPEYDWADGVTLRLFELPDGFDETVTVPAADAGVDATDVDFRVRRTGDEVVVTTGSGRAWALESAGRTERFDAGTGEGRITLA
ncbi:alpha-xylosidase [Luteimicrobium subarcticum]|uniref:alpha-D-xyloside xylohydrolase n=1 Tax=Luteimicrobium subarcticum TaxID=620910 RepID=A0A2M8WR46_9MICO|nr:alpha-xylosidase [Luteimicrobium subarcticum]PJI93405.1 alpha-D-xyloside xylohydrolase [Luteimicrobium subarcticum]